MKQRNLNCFLCEGEGCDPTQNQSSLVCENAVMCWKSTARDAESKETSSRGCISNKEQIPFYCNLQLHSNKKIGEFRIQCCQENLCNGGPFPSLQNPTIDADISNNINLIILMVGPLVGLILLIGGMFVCYLINKSKNVSISPSRSKNSVESGSESGVAAPSSSSTSSGGTNISSACEIRATACGDSTIKLMYGHSLTSGSGSGLPVLVQRTLVQQVCLVECLNSDDVSGKFGRQIWRGTWHGEDVAVKILFSRDEAKWTRETEVYTHLLPARHDNILGHIGSDMTSQGSCTELWLVTNYHKDGSLRNYLKQLSQPLTHQQVFNICSSIVNGLLHLHTEINGTQGKPALAHRNLSSKSIIMKPNGTCAIADLAHVVTQDSLATDKLDFKQISKRYMSPEFLEQTFDRESLETFHQADVYSLSLVFWEVCRCCISNNDTSPEYAAPFSEWLANENLEPTLEEMKKLVITDQRKPSIPNHWQSDPMLAGMGELMKECWYTKASSRLPILRVKKSLNKTIESDPGPGPSRN